MKSTNKNKRPHYMGILLTQELRTRIEKLAHEESRSLGSTIRLLLTEALAKRDFHNRTAAAK